jgi:hypothetical protein
MSAAADGPLPSDFRAVAVVQGDSAPNVPVRVALPQEVISKTRGDFADLRLFDDAGQETPYVIYRQTRARQAPVSFPFEVVSYNDAEASEEIVVKRPDYAGAFREIEFIITGSDFKKLVQVEAGSDGDSLQTVASDAIFDFSSRVDLRKTSVSLPETDADYLRVLLRDDAEPRPDSPEMRLSYEGLEFSTTGTGVGPFRVNRILGWTGERRQAEHFYDRVTIQEPKSVLDKEGNTIVYPVVRLPVVSITFDVENPYYYRRIQLLTAVEDRDEDYRVARSGLIYRMPGMAESEDTLEFSYPTSYLRLKVLNGDNPPLRLRSVEIAWVRRNLYFVPEADRSYELYLGSDVVRQPRYELERLIPSDHTKLRQYAAMSLSGLRNNPKYDPQLRPATRETVERTVFAVLVVALVCALALWAFRLLKRMPVKASE